jgi:Tfp pilus assembly protein PilZ
MIKDTENRSAERTDHITPLQVKDLKSDEIHEARMFNYSCSGIYLESDCVYEKGTTIYISIQRSPYSISSGVFEYYKGKVIWRKDLKRALFKHGYGIHFVAGSSKQEWDANGEKKSKDMRKHPRKPFFQTIRLGTQKGISLGDTKNISASGVFIAAEENLEIGQTLKLNFPLKNGDTVERTGQIKWLNKAGFGIKFEKIV